MLPQAEKGSRRFGGTIHRLERGTHRTLNNGGQKLSDGYLTAIGRWPRTPRAKRAVARRLAAFAPKGEARLVLLLQAFTRPYRASQRCTSPLTSFCPSAVWTITT